MNGTHSKAFTLVEVMVVVSIVSLISSIVMAGVHTARVKAQDTRKIAEVAQVRNALMLYYDEKGRMPYNYTCSGGCTPNTNPSTVSAAVEGTLEYNASMQELVDEGMLPQIPMSDDGESYIYFNDIDESGGDHAIFVAMLSNPISSGTASQQCAWQFPSNFSTTITGYPDGGQTNPGYYYFMNSVGCYERIISPFYPFNEVPSTQCTEAAANPANIGKCIVRLRQTMSRYYTVMDYMAGYTCPGAGYGPIYRYFYQGTPQPSEFPIYSSYQNSYCSSTSDFCTCYP